MSKLNVKQLQILNNEISLVDIGFEVTQSTALIGQSGSGKSLTLRSLLGMLPHNLTLRLMLNVILS